MKKITLLLLTFLCSFVGYSQFPENFEAPGSTVPTGFPTGWITADNGVGTGQSWTIANNAAVIITNNGGTQSAYINREEIGSGNTSEDWLISPSTAIPTNGQLRFFTKQSLAGDNGTLYQIRISSGTQSLLSGYTILKQWTEAELNAIYNVAEEKVVDFPTAAFGANRFIAFVRVYTQPIEALDGDRWFIDDINVTEKCLNPTSLTVTNIYATGAQVMWTAVANSLGYEFEIIPENASPTGIPTGLTTTNSFFIDFLVPNFCYKYYVRSNCGNGNFSQWVGPYSFCTLALGENCNTPITIALPFQTTDNTINFGNALAGPQSSSCISGAVNYQAGNDVFYNYTATENCNVSFTLNSQQAGSSLFIYPSCTGIAGTCLAAAADATNNTRELNLQVVLGQTYIIVVSSSAVSPTIDYNLTIQCENCNIPTNVTVSNITPTNGMISWDAPETENLGFDIYLVPSGEAAPNALTSPTFSGVNGLTTPFLFTIPNILLPNTAYDVYVRTQCLSGYSLWSEVVTFITMATCPKPLDSGTSSQSANAANLNWYEAGAATQWEVFATSDGTVPDNAAPLNTGIAGYYLANTNTNFIVTGLTPTVAMEFYVRAICSSFDFSDWTKIEIFSSDKIELNAFIDANNNGIKDATEVNFQYGNFTYVKNNDGITNLINGEASSYTLYDSNPLNTYSFNYEIDSEFAAYYGETPTNYANLSIQEGSGIQTLYFPITITQTYNDVQVSITSLNSARPGFQLTHLIIYKNVGHNTISGTINYTKDNPNVTITSVSKPGTVAMTNGFTYDYTMLLPGQTRSMYVYMNVATIPTVNLGDILTHTVAITSSETDSNLTDNTFTSVQTVVGSYDPNDKTEARGESVQIGQFNQGDYLYYTIRFQNSGTASAETVRIEDTLESEFDFASIRMVSASHNYTMQRVNNKVVWTFDYINLPSEMADEAGSHGYVTFKIKLNPGFAVNDVIENTAEIYFDFNPAIVTNTFQTTFVPNLSTPTFDVNNLIVYPNPAKDLVQASLQNSIENLEKIVIYDMIGKTIKTISGNNAQQISIPVNDLSTGVYLIEITTGTKLKQVRKLMVN